MVHSSTSIDRQYSKSFQPLNIPTQLFPTFIPPHSTPLHTCPLKRYSPPNSPLFAFLHRLCGAVMNDERRTVVCIFSSFVFDEVLVDDLWCSQCRRGLVWEWWGRLQMPAKRTWPPAQADSLGMHPVAHHPTSLFETFDGVKMISTFGKGTAVRWIFQILLTT